jgi:Thioredoxin like C-terminal domain
MVIQRLLGEAGRDTVPHDLVSITPDGLEAQADWASLKSPETYLCYEQTRGFASPGDTVLDQTHNYLAPDRLNLNHWALAGDWTIEGRLASDRSPQPPT